MIEKFAMFRHVKGLLSNWLTGKQHTPSVPSLLQEKMMSSLDFDSVSFFHFPGISLGDIPNLTLGNGILLPLPFEWWAHLDQEQPYLQALYDTVAPVFFLIPNTDVDVSGPIATSESFQRSKEDVDLAYLSLCLATSQPLPSPSLSVAYTEGGRRTRIGDTGRHWVFWHAENPFQLDQASTKLASEYLQLLEAARGTDYWPTIRSLLDIFELSAVPGALYRLDATNQVSLTSDMRRSTLSSDSKIQVETVETRHHNRHDKKVNVFLQLPDSPHLRHGLATVGLENSCVLCVSAIEDTLAADIGSKSSEASLSAWFGSCVYTYLQSAFLNSPFTESELSNLYSLRSKLIHGQVRDESRYAPERVEAMRQGHKILSAVIIAMSSRAASLPARFSRQSAPNADIPILAGASAAFQKLVNQEWEEQPVDLLGGETTPPDLADDNYMRSVFPLWGIELQGSAPITITPFAVLFKPSSDLWWWKFAEPELKTLFMDWNADEMMDVAPTLFYVKQPIPAGFGGHIPYPGSGALGLLLKETCSDFVLALQLAGVRRLIDPASTEQIFWWDLLHVRHFGPYRGIAYDTDVSHGREAIEDPERLEPSGRTLREAKHLYGLVSTYRIVALNSSADLAIQNFRVSLSLGVTTPQRLAAIFTALDVMMGGMSAIRVGSYRVRQDFCDRLTMSLLLAGNGDARRLAEEVYGNGRKIRNAVAHGRIRALEDEANATFDVVFAVVRSLLPLYLRVAIVQATAPNELQSPLRYHSSMSLRPFFNRLLDDVYDTRSEIEQARAELTDCVERVGQLV